MLFDKALIIISLTLLSALKISAGNTDSLSVDTTKKVKRNRFYGFPVLFYLPETRFGVGGAGIYSFRFKSDSTQARPSRVNIGFAVTQNKQLLLYLPFQLFPQNGLYNMYGEIGWYRYNFFFFGVGNEQAPDYQERYAVDFPRVRLSALRRVSPGLYAGVRWWFEDWKLTELEQGKQLISNTVSGSNGGRVTGPGLVMNYDTRNSVFFPTKGVLIESSFQTFSKTTGSEYSFNRLLVDAAYYTKALPSSVVAVNAIADFNQGQPPFNLMALMGGTKRMRGFYEGRFRDNNLVLLQTEWRQQIWKRFGAVAFGGAGIVADKVEHLALQHTRFTYGLGLRFTLDKKEHINVRLDYGRGTYNSSGFYLTIGEAF
jgi:Omp85 superfamily domain